MLHPYHIYNFYIKIILSMGRIDRILISSHLGVHPSSYMQLARDTTQKLIGPNAIWTTKQSTVKSKLKRFWSPTLNDLARAILRIAICRLPKFVLSHLGGHPSSYMQLAQPDTDRSKRNLDYQTHKTVHCEARNQN